MTHLCSFQFACEQGLRVQGEDGYEASRRKWGGWGRVRGSAEDEEAEPRSTERQFSTSLQVIIWPKAKHLWPRMQATYTL